LNYATIGPSEFSSGSGAYRALSLEIILPARKQGAFDERLCEHHKDSTRLGYRCFDRILLNGLIQPFQQPEWVVGYFNSYREVYRGQPRCAARCRQTVSNLG
jgi:hypothetical protein